MAPMLASEVLQRFVLRFGVYLEVDIFYSLLLALVGIFAVLVCRCGEDMGHGQIIFI